MRDAGPPGAVSPGAWPRRMARWHGHRVLWLSPCPVSRSLVSAHPGRAPDPLACPDWGTPGAGLRGAGRRHGGGLGDAFCAWPSAAAGRAVFTAGGGEGHGAVGPPRGRGVLRAGAQCPPASAGDSATRASRPSISGSPCARRSVRLATLGVSWRICARPRPSRRPSTTRVGWDRSRSFCQTISTRMGAYDQAIAAAQRALALATASGDVVLQALANHYLGLAYQAQGDYRRAIDCFRQTVASLDGARRHERFGQVFLPAVHSRACLAWCHAELGTFAEGRALGEEGLRIAEAVAHPASLMFASWGIGLLALRQGDLPRALPRARTGRGHLSGRGPPGLFPQDGCGLGGGVHPGRARRRRRAAAHAGAGTDHCDGTSRLSGALSSLPGGGAAAGWPPGGGARPRRAGAGARPCAPGTWPPGVCPAPPRRHCGAARAPRERARPKPTTARPSPWPRNSACARSRPTATAASARCMPRPASGSRPAPSCPPPSTYRAMDMTFWLPQAEAVDSVT